MIKCGHGNGRGKKAGSGERQEEGMGRNGGNQTLFSKTKKRNQGAKVLLRKGEKETISGTSTNYCTIQSGAVSKEEEGKYNELYVSRGKESPKGKNGNKYGG